MTELADEEAKSPEQLQAQELNYYCFKLANSASLEALCSPTNLTSHVLYERADLGTVVLRSLGRASDTFRFELGLTAADQSISMRLPFYEMYAPDPDNPGEKKLMLMHEHPITAEDLADCPWPTDKVLDLASGLYYGEDATVSDITDHPRHVANVGAVTLQQAG